MTARISLLSLSFLSAAANIVSAGEPPASTKDAMITQKPASSPWRFGAAYAPLVGLKTKFGGLGQFNSNFTPQPLGGGRNYDYDDGFVHLDSSDNLDDQTWNWGYDNANQYDPSGSGSINLSITNSLADARTSDDNQAEAGVELFAYFDMGTVEIPVLKERGATWGFRGGVHYAHVENGSHSILTSGTVRLTDSFDLGGNILIPDDPFTGFSGSYEGPGTFLGDSPDRSIGAGTPAFVEGSRDLDVRLTTLSFGTYLEIPVAPKFSMTLEGGLNAGLASGSYDFDSSTSIAGLGTQNSSGSDSEFSLLPGFYLGLSGIYQLNESWAIQAAGRYQYLESFDLKSNGSNASLSFDSAFVLSLGAIYSF